VSFISSLGHRGDCACSDCVGDSDCGVCGKQDNNRIYRGKSHCQTCIKKARGTSNVVEDLRQLLLPLTAEERVEALYETGICDGCGGDKMAKKGKIKVCHCRNDE
jgi:hypothetical protein